MAYGYIDHMGRFIVPDVIEDSGKAVINPTDKVLAELGYLEKVETPQPSDGQNYEEYYVEKDLKAVQHWRAIPEPQPTEEERIAQLEAALDLLLSGVTE